MTVEASEPNDDCRSLVTRCLSGDQPAMTELVERFRGQVYGLCYRMLGQRQDAEDAVQETFVRVLRSLGRWDPQRDFEPWLLAIAGNRCRTVLQRRRHRPVPRSLGDEQVETRDHQLAASQLAEEVFQALEQLRPKHRDAFLLFHQHELSYHEIAQRLDCPVGTVKTWVHRARRALIDQLKRRGTIGE